MSVKPQLLEEQNSSGEQEFLANFASVCSQRANADYYSSTGKVANATGVEDAEFDEFLSSQLPVYTHAVELGKNLLLEQLQSEQGVVVEDPIIKIKRVYRYNFVTDTLYFEPEVKKDKAVDFLDAGLDGFDEPVEVVSEPTIEQVQLYSDPALVKLMLAEGMVAIEREYSIFCWSVERLERFREQGWRTIKNIPYVADNLFVGKNYALQIKKNKNLVQGLAWFVQQKQEESNLLSWAKETQQITADAERLGEFFVLASSASGLRRLDCERSFAVTLIGDKYELSDIPRISIEDVMQINAIAYKIEQDYPDLVERERLVLRLAQSIFLTRKSALEKLLVDNAMPVQLGLMYFEHILIDYLTKKVPEDPYRDIVTKKRPPYEGKNLLHSRYITLGDTRETEERDYASFLISLRDKDQLNSVLMYKIDSEKLAGLLENLSKGRLEEFTLAEYQNAMLLFARYFRIIFDTEQNIFTTDSKRRPSLPAGAGEVFDLLITNLSENFDLLPDSIKELLVNLYVYSVAPELAQQKSFEASTRAQVAFFKNYSAGRDFRRLLDISSEDMLMTDIDLVVDFNTLQIIRRIFTQNEYGGYYFKPFDTSTIGSGVVSWMETNPELCVKICNQFDLSSIQLRDYISVKIQGLISSTKATLSNTEGALRYYLGESSYSAKSPAKKEKIDTFDLLTSRNLSAEQFRALSRFEQVKIIDSAFEIKDPATRARAFLDLYRLIGFRYDYNLKDFALGQSNELKHLRERKVLVAKHFLGRLKEGVEKDKTVSEVLETLFLRSRLGVQQREIPKRLKGKPGLNYRNDFLTFYLRVFDADLGFPSEIYSAQSIAEAVKSFLSVNAQLIERYLANRNSKIKNEADFYKVADIEEVLIEITNYYRRKSMSELYGYYHQDDIKARGESLIQLLEKSLLRIK